MNPLTVTNDGATILRSIGIDNPAGKILVGKSVLEFGEKIHITTWLVAQNVYFTTSYFTRPE